MKAEIGVLGGTGLYDPEFLEDSEELDIETPYGKPSDLISVGTLGGRKVAFMPRHGRDHSILPHMINFRANVWAFKDLGVDRIIAPSTVGSLREEIEPGHFALPSQFMDFTKSRVGSFAEKGRVFHISMADPFCGELQETVLRAAEACKIRIHRDCTYACIEGPRFSTRAESRFFRSAGADVIGMTLVPECQLAREARICFVSISMVTDYDAWSEGAVTARQVREIFSRNRESVKSLLALLAENVPPEKHCGCASALDDAEL